MGQKEYLLEINGLDVESLKARFEALEEGKDRVRSLIEANLPKLQEALEKQYDLAFDWVQQDNMVQG